MEKERTLQGLNLRRIRKSKKLTQDELAQILGVTNARICQLETGGACMRNAGWKRLASMLCVEEYEFLRPVNDPESLFREPEPKTPSECVIAWKKRNPGKVRVAGLTQRHPDRLVILYECSHNHTKKHHHHPYYDRPYEVIRLCPACHHDWHKRVREITKEIEP